jgi:hypothetical protein
MQTKKHDTTVEEGEKMVALRRNAQTGAIYASWRAIYLHGSEFDRFGSA